MVLKHRRFLGRIIVAAGFKHEHFSAFHRERIGGLAAGGTGADDDDIVFLPGLLSGNSGHDEVGGDELAGGGAIGAEGNGRGETI